LDTGWTISTKSTNDNSLINSSIDDLFSNEKNVPNDLIYGNLLRFDEMIPDPKSSNIISQPQRQSSATLSQMAMFLGFARQPQLTRLDVDNLISRYEQVIPALVQHTKQFCQGAYTSEEESLVSIRGEVEFMVHSLPFFIWRVSYLMMGFFIPFASTSMHLPTTSRPAISEGVSQPKVKSGNSSSPAPKTMS
jgi:hypothetical protein